MPVHPAATAQRRDPDAGITIFDHGAADEATSVVRAELHGRHMGLPNRRSSTTYVVTSGWASITVDEERHEATAGDIVMAGVNTRRTLRGDAELIIINAPPFDPADEVPTE